MVTVRMLIVYSLGWSALAQAPIPVMPMPARATPARGELTLDATFRVSTAGYRDAFLEQAVARLARNLSAKTGLAIDGALTPDGKSTKLRIRCKGPGDASPDESYKLTVLTSGAELHAATPIGVLHGLSTFFQLVTVTPAGATIAGIAIDDHPRFAWRGLMLDVSRHFVPTDLVLRQIDAMEAVKLNVLHLHLTDAQGFRVESKVYPKLTEAGSEGQFYSQDDIRRIIAYARDRGIRIVPEFDVPGHTKGWLAGYPELGSKPGPYGMGTDPDAMNATLDPTKESVYEFLDRLFDEMAQLFPDPYFHIGGDEVTGIDWNQNPAIQRFMKQKGFADRHDLQAYFTGRVREMLAKRGKITIGWDEVLRPDLPTDIVVQTWQSSKMTARAATTRHATIVSAGYYLDWVMPAAFHYALDPLDTAAYGATARQLEMAKGTPLEPYLSDNKIVNGPTPMTPADERRVLGGEATLFSELVTAEMLDGRLWPRTAAIAERLWSPRTQRDPDSMYTRLASLDRDLEALGLKHRSNPRLMLERLAPGANGPVRIFAEAVEPVKFYARMGRLLAAYMNGTPITDEVRLADAIVPESLKAHEFEREVKRTLASRSSDQESRDYVRARLTTWRDNGDTFAAAAKEHAALREALPLSDDLRVLSQAGLDALSYWEKRQAAPADWVATQRALIEKHKQIAAASADALGAMLRPQPPCELLIAVVPAIELLVNAAAHK